MIAVEVGNCIGDQVIATRRILVLIVSGPRVTRRRIGIVVVVVVVVVAIERLDGSDRRSQIMTH